MTKRTRTRTRKPVPGRRIDVTRLEYQRLLEMAQRNQENIQRLERDAAIQFKRTVEQQAEIDALKKAVFK